MITRIIFKIFDYLDLTSENTRTYNVKGLRNVVGRKNGYRINAVLTTSPGAKPGKF